MSEDGSGGIGKSLEASERKFLWWKDCGDEHKCCVRKTFRKAHVKPWARGKMELLRASGRISLAVKQEKELREEYAKLGLFYIKCRAKGGLLRLFFTCAGHQQLVLLVSPSEVHPHRHRRR